MSALFEQLGIDWKLLLSQAANFAILLIILRMFVYAPILKILRERQQKIAEGIEKAEESDLRLKEANSIALQKIKKAENEAVQIIKQTETKAKDLEAKLVKQAQEKGAELLHNAELAAIAKREEKDRMIRAEAIHLIKNAIAKTVELSPQKIDETLIKKAVEHVK